MAVGGGISVVCLTRTSRYRSKRRSWLVPLLPTAIAIEMATLTAMAMVAAMATVTATATATAKCYHLKGVRLASIVGLGRPLSHN
jgi:hypothetical protein